MFALTKPFREIQTVSAQKRQVAGKHPSTQFNF